MCTISDVALTRDILPPLLRPPPPLKEAERGYKHTGGRNDSLAMFLPTILTTRMCLAPTVRQRTTRISARARVNCRRNCGCRRASRSRSRREGSRHITSYSTEAEGVISAGRCRNRCRSRLYRNLNPLLLEDRHATFSAEIVHCRIA